MIRSRTKVWIFKIQIQGQGDLVQDKIAKSILVFDDGVTIVTIQYMNILKKLWYEHVRWAWKMDKLTK